VPILRFLAYFCDVIYYVTSHVTQISYVTNQQVLISKYDISFITNSFYTQKLYRFYGHKSLSLKFMTTSIYKDMKVSACLDS